MKRFSSSLLLVGALLGVSCYAQTQPGNARNNPSHRIIPRGNPGDAGDYPNGMTTELFDLWRRLEAAQNADRRQSRQRPAEPRFRTMPESNPGYLAEDSTELLQELSQQVGRSMVEAMNTDITEFAQEANRRFLENLRAREPLPEGSSPQQLAFDPAVDVDRNLQRLWSQVRDHQEDFAQILQQYQQSWPSESVPPREWIQKVQPFINQELVQQLSAAAQQLRADKARASTANGPRPSERNGLSSKASSSQASSAGHSNPVVASVLKAFDNQSTSLIKSATSRKPSRGRSWWKSLQAKSKSKVRNLNRKLTANIKQVAASRTPRFPARRDSAWSTRSTSTPAGFVALVFMLGGCLLAIWSLSTRRPLAPGMTREHVEEPPDPQAIQDRVSLLLAFHTLGGRMFGLPCRFWNHRQFFDELKQTAELDGPSIEVLSDIYERARYAAQGSPLTREDLFAARQLFSKILNHSVVSP